MVQEDDAAEELGSHAATNGSNDVYISVPDSNPMPADMHTIKGLSYTQAFGIYKVCFSRPMKCITSGPMCKAHPMMSAYRWARMVSKDHDMTFCFVGAELCGCPAPVSN